MIDCGVSFVSVSLFAVVYFLTIEEAHALKRIELVAAIKKLFESSTLKESLQL